MSWALYACAGYLTLAFVVVICLIGRPRKPLTPGGALTAIIPCAVMIVILVLAGVRLS